MFKKQLSILFIICLLQHSSCFIDTFFTLAQKSWKIMLFLNDVQFSGDTLTKIEGIFVGSGDDEKVLEQLTMINRKLDDLKSYISHQFDYVELLLESLADEMGIRTKERDLSAFVAVVNGEWDAFVALVMKNVSREEYNPLITRIRTSIEVPLWKFRNDITPAATLITRDSGLFMSIAKLARDKKDIVCGHGETYHHTLVRLYQIILMTEIKANSLLTFAYTNGTSRNGGHPLYDNVKSSFRRQFSRYFQELTRSLTVIRPYLRACDPEGSWRRDVDFIELNGFIQRTVYRRGDGCSGFSRTCSLDADDCSMVTLNEHSTCRGQLYDCTIMHKVFRDTEVCVWDDGPYKIRYIHHGDEVMGVDTVNTCPPNNFHEFTVFGNNEAFCDCQCYSEKWRFVGKMQRSRWIQNYVIVGLRFKKVENYIFIQIAEGRLESNGHISDFSWTPESREITGWWDAGEFLLANSRSAFFLDDLQLPPGCVLTGIQFRPIIGDRFDGIGFQIEGTKFDYETGKLDQSDWPAAYSRFSRFNNELTYTAKNSITMQPLKHHAPDSDEHDYITFRESDRDADFGQSTLPLLDSVPVLTNPLSPIGGVGFFHKGYEGYAGFLSLRLFPVDYAYFMKVFADNHDLNSESTWNNGAAITVVLTVSVIVSGRIITI